MFQMHCTQPTMYKFFSFKIEVKTKADSYMPCEAMAHSTKSLVLVMTHWHSQSHMYYNSGLDCFSAVIWWVTQEQATKLHFLCQNWWGCYQNRMGASVATVMTNVFCKNRITMSLKLL